MNAVNRPVEAAGEPGALGKVNRLIAGSGRSGTTWILDAIAQANSMRTVFEPLLEYDPGAGAASACRALRPEHDDQALQTHWDRAFSGRLRSVWTDYRVRPERLLPSTAMLYSPRAWNTGMVRWLKLFRQRRRYGPTLRRRRILVKAIRANLMLEWLAEHFDVRIVVVMRHPAAVVESQLRLGGDDWDPRPALAYYASVPGLLESLGREYRVLVESETTLAAALTLRWCIENAAAQRAVSAGVGRLVYYEHLAEHRAAAWRDLVAGLALPNAPSQEVLTLPSQQASREFRNAGAEPRRPGWMRRLDDSSRIEIAAILERLQIGTYTLDASGPQLKNIEAVGNAGSL